MATGKARMAGTGYYVQYFVDQLGQIIVDVGIGIRPIFITKDQKSQYHAFGSWTTLLWSCAPTKDAVSRTPAQVIAADGTGYYFYPTYADFASSIYFGGEPKAPKDI